ncbi:MAG: flagellar hook-basal body complex protein FliE [Bacillota bacterium]|nr:flagellar hook-basal body complex protein FliE [Bacillota bacterium]
MNVPETKQDDSTLGTFGDILKDKIGAVNDQQINAENVTESFVKGDDTDIHNVMLATSEATMSLQLAIQIRNKFIDAYQELNRMQV